jgi:anaerobic carbon-monoxide dehydrogenase iron sulfur subunit
MTERKNLSIDPRNCDGCRECEGACSRRHAGGKGWARPRIEVLGGDEGFHMPVTCQQCVNPLALRPAPKAPYAATRTSKEF